MIDKPKALILCPVIGLIIMFCLVVILPVQASSENTRSYPYVVFGKSGTINITTNEMVYNYFTDINTPIYRFDDYRFLINNSMQDEYLSDLITKIKVKSNNTEIQARIAISLVQHLEYRDSNKLHYPYVTLHDGGMCSDKSVLMVYLLKQIGYNTSLMYFEEEHHMAVGIKTDNKNHMYRDTGYAFIETTNPTPISFSEGVYNESRLESSPIILPVNGGQSFNNFSERQNYWVVETSRFFVQLGDLL